jgi:hypothetical protein
MLFEKQYISNSKYPLDNLNKDVIIYVVVYYCIFVKVVSIKGTNILQLTYYNEVFRNLKGTKVKKSHFTSQ